MSLRGAARTVAGFALALFLAPGPVSAAAAADSVRFTVAITDVNRIGMTVTNYGFFGNNFNSRSPSLEYPLGSGFEHMARAGLWVGGLALADTGAFLGVSAGIVDNVQGSNGTFETEFTPAGNSILQRSRISNNRFFSPEAVSDQDLIASYSDMPARGPAGNQRERHTPLQILVRQTTLGFSLDAAGDFVVTRFTIINLGPPLRDAYVGLYAQLVSGDKNAYAVWPPSSTTGPGSWYYKTYVEYDSTRRFYKERYCAQLPYPGGCNVAFAPPWMGVKLLRTEPGAVQSKRLSFHWWSFAPGDTARDEDRERYALLSDGGRDDVSTCIPGAGNCSPIMVLGVGPWPQIDPGDSVTVDFAFVGGSDEPVLLANADFAQFAADIDYRLPKPPPSPRLRVESAANRVDLYWDDSPEFDVDPTSPAPGGIDFEGYRVYLGEDRQAPTRVAQFDLAAGVHDTTGFNTGLGAVRLASPYVVDGVTYRYRHRIKGLRDGFRYYGAVTSYDLGDDQVASLESGLAQNKFVAVPNPGPGEAAPVTVYPNPYRVEALWDQGRQVRDHYLWFANLPPRAAIRIYTLSGDLVYDTRFDGATYRGDGARGLFDPRRDLDTPPPALSGASYAWNMITRRGQAIASGLYLYAVEDLDTGEVHRGKFLIVKSDREN